MAYPSDWLSWTKQDKNGGPHDAFIEAIETAQGAHDDPLIKLFQISVKKFVAGMMMKKFP